MLVLQTRNAIFKKVYHELKIKNYFLFICGLSCWLSHYTVISYIFNFNLNCNNHNCPAIWYQLNSQMHYKKYVSHVKMIQAAVQETPSRVWWIGMGATNTGRRPTPALDHTTPCYHPFNPPQIGTESHQLKITKSREMRRQKRRKMIQLLLSSYFKGRNGSVTSNFYLLPVIYSQ